MFLILNVILIILFNKTYAYITQDSEIILLPAWNPTGTKVVRFLYFSVLFIALRSKCCSKINQSLSIVTQFIDTTYFKGC